MKENDGLGTHLRVTFPSFPTVPGEPVSFPRINFSDGVLEVGSQKARREIQERRQGEGSALEGEALPELEYYRPPKR